MSACIKGQNFLSAFVVGGRRRNRVHAVTHPGPEGGMLGATMELLNRQPRAGDVVAEIHLVSATPDAAAGSAMIQDLGRPGRVSTL
jgi:hypothetical protein